MVSTVKIFNITIPCKDNLYCAICKIINFKNEPMIYSNYCGNKLKCRQFLQETPQAMTAPITNRKLLEAGGSFYVIVTKNFFENYTFRNHCDALNVQVMDVLDPIPTYVYKACLLHTMQFKLAPQWNKVGLYLVEGRDFLSSTGKVNAITLNIKNIYDNNAQLHVEALNLKIPFLRLNTAHSLSQRSVRVLPSLKVANVLSISKEIKEKYLFKDYKHLQEYWKDMHGYILPDYEEGFLFYNLEFFYFKSSVFLYPEICLTSGPPEILPLMIDPVSKIYKFARDLRERVTKLCEKQLDVCPENIYQAAVLTCTPILSRVVKLSTCDTGYETKSKRINSASTSSQAYDTCNITTKRSRLSLSGINDSLMCKTEIDNFNFLIAPTCSTNKCFNKLFETTDSAVSYNTDNTATSKPIVPKDESTSHYFKEEKQEEKSTMELIKKEEKFNKSNLKEKLLRNF